jgi:hypothetical protein
MHPQVQLVILPIMLGGGHTLYAEEPAFGGSIPPPSCVP